MFRIYGFVSGFRVEGSRLRAIGLGASGFFPPSLGSNSNSHRDNDDAFAC